MEVKLDSGNVVKQTWMPATAGILSTIDGAINICVSITIGLIVAAIGESHFSAPALGLVAIPLIILGIMAFTGGVFASKRRVWALSLTGTICGIVPPIMYFIAEYHRAPVRILFFDVPFIFVAVCALVLIVLSKREFH